MGGMEMMMKSMLTSMGFNPDELRAKFTSAAAEVKATVEHFDGRLTAIENRQVEILAAIQQLKGTTENDAREFTAGSGDEQRDEIRRAITADPGAVAASATAGDA